MYLFYLYFATLFTSVIFIETRESILDTYMVMFELKVCSEIYLFICLI